MTTEILIEKPAQPEDPYAAVIEDEKRQIAKKKAEQQARDQKLRDTLEKRNTDTRKRIGEQLSAVNAALQDVLERSPAVRNLFWQFILAKFIPHSPRFLLGARTIAFWSVGVSEPKSVDVCIAGESEDFRRIKVTLYWRWTGGGQCPVEIEEKEYGQLPDTVEFKLKELANPEELVRAIVHRALEG